MTIVDFLEARIDEDEVRAGSGWARLGDSRWETNNYGQDFLTPSAVLAECAAKRAIVGRHGDMDMLALCETCHDYSQHAPTDWPCDTLKAIAAVYADRPGYDPEWKL